MLILVTHRANTYAINLIYTTFRCIHILIKGSNPTKNSKTLKIIQQLKQKSNKKYFLWDMNYSWNLIQL